MDKSIGAGVVGLYGYLSFNLMVSFFLFYFIQNMNIEIRNLVCFLTVVSVLLLQVNLCQGCLSFDLPKNTKVSSDFLCVSVT